MTVTIRAAALADQEAVLDLMEQLFESPGGTPADYSRERARLGFKWAIEREMSDVLLAFVDGKLVGLSSVYVDMESIRYGRRCWLQDLVADRERRSGGVGKALLEASATWARERGCTHLELASGAGRVDAHRFYEREGMVKSAHFYRPL